MPTLPLFPTFLQLNFENGLDRTRVDRISQVGHQSGIFCSPMETSGIRKAGVADAKRAVLSGSPYLPAQSATIRKIIPWKMIKVRLDMRARKIYRIG
jgi:hypothetical protein